MPSRFNTIYLGSAEDAADALEDDSESSVDEVRNGLVNALRRIARLEFELNSLSRATRQED